MLHSAAIICTRNRPDALRNTITSIVHQDLAPSPSIIVVDASDAPALQQNRKTTDRFTASPVRHYLYEGPPSAARQRNLGLRLLPDAVDVVFFLDDDITLQTGCLRHLAEILESEPNLSGVGAIESRAANASIRSSNRTDFWKYFFLLDHPRPGRVLLSGHISRYQTLPDSERLVSTQWLSTCCCAYRRVVLDKVQFDEALRGALLEDRDLSFRVANSFALAAAPKARFIHHRSPINRRSAFQFGYERAIQRYWFVEKNIRHPLRRLAFWWATLGQTLAILTSAKDRKWEALQGHLRGVRAILYRDHPLLRNQ